MIRRWRDISRSRDGVSAVEFALIAPVWLGLLFGGLQLVLDVWANSVLTGAVHQAGRNSGLESARKSQTSIDQTVTDQVHAYLPAAALEFSRKNYQHFSDIGRPEDFTDSNHNGRYDPGECFDDENGNGVWDADAGSSGQGGARDVVVYTVTMTYTELLPLRSWFGLGKDRVMSASTTLMNQPFSTQADRVAKEVCS